MKKLVLWIGVLLFVASCSTQKKLAEKKTKPVEIEKTDSVEYQLETFDQRFENWYDFQNNPSQYRTKSYYENWNRQYIAAWDAKATNPIRNPFFEPIIGYNSSVDYGFKLNHKLFYYFQYVEHVLKIPILPDGPNVALY
ncbi:MAG: hypothetical protein IH595_00970 [Bacteroidales bacterium]|nr:hypothetical protein [Bacteroidales bacterium]